MVDHLFTLVLDNGVTLPMLFLVVLVLRVRVTVVLTRGADGLNWTVTFTL